jgi:hypothetical protein
MPLYYFDFHDGHRHSFDDNGQEFPDVNRARVEAIGSLFDVARNMWPGRDRRDCVAHVCEESGRIVFRVRLSHTPEWLT